MTKTPTAERFADRLARLRRAQGLSAQKLANLLNVPASTYRAWETGRAIQGHQALLDLSRTLSVSLGELLTGTRSQFFQVAHRLESVETELRSIRKLLLSLE